MVLLQLQLRLLLLLQGQLQLLLVLQVLVLQDVLLHQVLLLLLLGGGLGSGLHTAQEGVQQWSGPVQVEAQWRLPCRDVRSHDTSSFRTQHAEGEAGTLDEQAA